MIPAIGKVVAARRAALGLDRDQVAAEARVDAGHLAALEAGQPGITTTELERLALRLDLDLRELRGGRAVPRVEPSVFLRQHPYSDFVDADHELLDHALAQARALVALEDLVGESRTDLGLRRRAAGVKPAKQGHALARELRSALALGGAPLGELVAWIEAALHVAVVVAELSSSRVTALALRAGAAAAIVLNDADPHRQQHPAVARVHLAHELCHLFFDPEELGLKLVIEELDDRRKIAAEQRARAFAAELLLPEEGLRELLGPPAATDSLQEAKRLVAASRKRYGTPNEIAVNHLVNHRFIDDSLREALSHSSDASARVPVPQVPTVLPMPGRPSLRVCQLAQRAHQRHLVTDGQAKNLLGLDPLRPLPWDVDGA